MKLKDVIERRCAANTSKSPSSNPFQHCAPILQTLPFLEVSQEKIFVVTFPPQLARKEAAKNLRRLLVRC